MISLNVPRQRLDNLFKKNIKTLKNKHFTLENALIQQEIQLKKLLYEARKTRFGQHHLFRHILMENNCCEAFRQAVPLTTYEAMYAQWWRFALEDEADVCWPGIVPYYALSSGTSGASSKYIPVTREMLAEMKKATRRMFFGLMKTSLTARQLSRQMLMIGSCTNPKQEGQHYIGDLSGIMGQNRPLWLERYYRPGRAISDLPDWEDRIEAIVKTAPNWDIGFAVANPMWLQLIFEKLQERYTLNHIHELWPNLQVLIHGGVHFEPYRQPIEKMLHKPLQYINCYLASEGFIGRQQEQDSSDLHLLTDGGIYYEFVPFTAENFDENGNLSPGAQAIKLEAVKTGETYALVLSSVSGAWRYLLGDTIQFTQVESLRFRITGRTQQFLSVCGEHLSLDNLNEAVRRASLGLGASVREFAVAAFREGGLWRHRWWFSMGSPTVPVEKLMEAIDGELMILNDDYAVERRFALKSPEARLVPPAAFYALLQSRNKFNGQAKIPRILKGETLECWEANTAAVETVSIGKS